MWGEYGLTLSLNNEYWSDIVVGVRNRIIRNNTEHEATGPDWTQSIAWNNESQDLGQWCRFTAVGIWLSWSWGWWRIVLGLSVAFLVVCFVITFSVYLTLWPSNCFHVVCAWERSDLDKVRLPYWPLLLFIFFPVFC